MVDFLLFVFYFIILLIKAEDTGSGIPGTTFKKRTWTAWIDRDSGPNQLETYDAIVARGWKLCTCGKSVTTECMRTDTGVVLSDGHYFNTSLLLGTDLQCSLKGIECHNERCMNLKVRFLCEEEVIDGGSPAFYFLIFVVPVTAILFRLYCWDFIKTRFLKRHIGNSNCQSRRNQESTNASIFDPPSYDDLFGPEMENRNMKCNVCKHFKPIITNDQILNTDNETSNVRCSCRQTGNLPTSGATDNHSVNNQTTLGHQNGAISVGYNNNNEIDGNSENTVSGIYVIGCEELPPPSYSEALVILKRMEGLDASHL